MTLEDVQIEMGRAESKMELGSRQILIYEDGTRLEFIDGKLAMKNNQALPTKNPEKDESAKESEPLVRAEDLIQQREETTITTSVRSEQIDYSKLSDSYSENQTFENLQAEIATGRSVSELESGRATGNGLQQSAILFGIEILVVLLVLSIAFQVSGFPCLFRQLFLLSLVVALAGTALDILLGTDPMNPIRSALGFAILMVLIRQLTDVQEWITAIKIAFIARIVSFVIIWVLMLGLSMLFSM
ncbi:MAG: hypothetical protein ACPGSB_00725 [Opitutales bacterium]